MHLAQVRGAGPISCAGEFAMKNSGPALPDRRAAGRRRPFRATRGFSGGRRRRASSGRRAGRSPGRREGRSARRAGPGTGAGERCGDPRRRRDRRPGPRRPMAPPPGDAALPAARYARVGAPPGRRPGRRTAPGRGARHAEAGRRRERTGPGGPGNRAGKGADSALNHTIYPPFRGFSPPTGGRQGAAWRLECPLLHIAGRVATGRRADSRRTVASIPYRATGKRQA